MNNKDLAKEIATDLYMTVFHDCVSVDDIHKTTEIIESVLNEHRPERV